MTMHQIDNEPTAQWWRCDHPEDLKVHVWQQPRPRRLSANQPEWWDCDDPYPETIPMDRITALDTFVDVNSETITCVPDEDDTSVICATEPTGAPAWIAIHSVRPPIAGRWRPVARPDENPR